MLRKKTKQLFALHSARGDNGNGPSLATIRSVNRITKLMTLYPCVYVILTLPLSAGRMWSYAHGTSYSDAYACVAGAMITSCGWVDTLLYTLTRKKLLRDTMPGTTNRTRGSDWDNELGSKGITHTRTVTVEGGQVLDTLAPSTGYQSTQQTYTNSQHGHSHQNSGLTGFTYERPASPSGSVDPILANKQRKKSEVSIGLAELDEQEKQDEITSLPPTWLRHR
jgi:hypothetical protein